MDVDDTTSTEKNSGSAGESKSNAKSLDTDKGKGKRKLYVGSQALGFRRDNMEVSMFAFIDSYLELSVRILNFLKNKKLYQLFYSLGTFTYKGWSCC